MRLKDITSKTDAELVTLVTSLRSDLAKAVVDSRTKEIKDVKQIGRLKTAISRTLTVARERQIAKMEAAE
jgi:ribosomal protein L29